MSTVRQYYPDAQRVVWSKPTLRTTHREPASGVIDGKFYVVGGANPAAGKTQTAVLDACDPATNTWAQKPSMPTPRYALAATKVNGALYAMDGYGYTTLRANEAYKPCPEARLTDLTAAARFLPQEGE